MDSSEIQYNEDEQDDLADLEQETSRQAETSQPPDLVN